jgi:hypothetical protein
MIKHSDIHLHLRTLGWTPTEHEIAREQGWRLNVMTHGRVMVFRHSRVLNHTTRFGSRIEAERFVTAQAQKGDVTCQKAVALMIKARLL